MKAYYAYLILVIIFAVAAPGAEARTPRSREATAVIKELHPETCSVVLSVEKEGEVKVLELRWTRLSSAYRDSKEVFFGDLKPGLKVNLKYRNPLFGGPTIRRITWREADPVSLWRNVVAEISYG